MRGKIGISTMLAEIRTNPGEPFVLEFVRSSGSAKGSIVTVAQAMYGRPKTALAEKKKGYLRKKSLFKKTAQLPITDFDSGRFLTPLISHIISYNNFQVIH